MPARVEPPVRFGIVSFAMYHGNFWSQAVRESGLATFVGIWDNDAERGEVAAKTYGTRFWPDLDSLLDACDAVGITSETAYHADLADRAAARGCHILCEKPLATTMADCDRIQASVERADVWFMQSFPKRFDPVNLELKRLVEEDELGRITLMRVRHGHLYGLLGGKQHSGWPEDPYLSGGGALLDEGVHGADLIRWFLGEPDAVMATISYAVLNHKVEDLGLAVFMYDDGPICELVSSVTFAAGDNSVEIFGTEGTAILTGVDLASRDLTADGFLKICRLSDENRKDPTTRRWTIPDMVPGFKSTPQFHQQNPLQFLEALTQGKAPPTTIEDGRRSLQMILSAYESARSGKTVRIPRDSAGGPHAQ
ncbi:MAG: Gfo/Idh/MocA family oxidoreductase [Gammaproteobacteria bacterium]|nr:MAG: Gfo/Idh/MocA family oxidoreductase [Gammaproteobacteria bacterium]